MTKNTVSRLNVLVLEVPFEKPITSALGTYIGADYVVVEIETSDGFIGYGYTMSLDRRGTTAVISYIKNEYMVMPVTRSMIRS